MTEIDVCVKPWITRITYPDGHTIPVPPSQWVEIVRQYVVLDATQSAAVADAWYFEALMSLRSVAVG